MLWAPEWGALMQVCHTLRLRICSSEALWSTLRTVWLYQWKRKRKWKWTADVPGGNRFELAGLYVCITVKEPNSSLVFRPQESCRCVCGYGQPRRAKHYASAPKIQQIGPHSSPAAGDKGIGEEWGIGRRVHARFTDMDGLISLTCGL
jgi:hypothetical protein